MSQHKCQLGVVMDPLEGIKPAKDSTLAMLLAAQARGWDLIYFQQNGLAVRDGQPSRSGLDHQRAGRRTRLASHRHTLARRPG